MLISCQLAPAWIAARVLTLASALGPPDLGGTPVPDDEGEINWLLDAPWAKVALLITLAVGVMILTNSLMRKKKGARGLRRKPDFDLRVAKLEELPITTIAAARAGEVHLAGDLRVGEGALGTGAHACVYQNRARSSRATAIAAELILLEDESGLVGLEQLEDARVIAPKEERGAHDTIALYAGDRVEVVGELMIFDQPQTVAGQPLRGMLGSLGQIQVRVLERPEHEDTRLARHRAPTRRLSNPEAFPSTDDFESQPDDTGTP
ncbi:hypothetical protein ENSA5_11260 [Enhygromyxa salina]|uniref:Uncharacterized protein n=1 Tax=Enhygromyxa salina TaxID=215803 RepID=A0A2S9YG59_9BACT|nr:hypothetical protein [Enhygromyxa salina]PRQ04078.1 hypothetical protein ENSA5_11260 [Enhygromyxa salina]